MAPQLEQLCDRREEINQIFESGKFVPMYSNPQLKELKAEHDSLLDEWEAIICKIEILELWIPELLKQEVGSEDYFICVEALASTTYKLQRIQQLERFCRAAQRAVV